MGFRMKWSHVNNLSVPCGSIWGFSATSSITLMKASSPRSPISPQSRRQLLAIKCYVHPRYNSVTFVVAWFCFGLFGFCLVLFQGKWSWADLPVIPCWCNFLCCNNTAPNGRRVNECRTNSCVCWVTFQVLGSWEIYNQGRQEVRNHVLEQEINILGCIRSYRLVVGVWLMRDLESGTKNEPLSPQSTDILHLLN